MNFNEKDKLFNACLDGQLSAAEAARFDESLSQEEKDRLTAEVKLEARLSEMLCGDVPCPDAVWRRTQMLVNNQATGRGRRFSGMARMLIGAAAALALFVFGSLYLNGGGEGGDLFAVNAATVGEFASQARITGEHDDLCGYLKARGVGVTLRREEELRGAMHHTLRVLGLCPGNCHGQEVQQVYLDCCGNPIKIVIAATDSAAARTMLEMKRAGKVQELREVGGYVAGVIGPHPAHEALLILIERKLEQHGEENSQE